MPQLGTGLQPRHVPWPGIKPKDLFGLQVDTQPTEPHHPGLFSGQSQGNHCLILLQAAEIVLLSALVKFLFRLNTHPFDPDSVQPFWIPSPSQLSCGTVICEGPSYWVGAPLQTQHAQFALTCSEQGSRMWPPSPDRFPQLNAEPVLAKGWGNCNDPGESLLYCQRV